MTVPERPIEKRGGYQPIATGPAPTSPPPKPGEARVTVPALDVLREVLRVLSIDPEWNDRADNAVAAVAALEWAAGKRLSAGHNDTCDTVLSPGSGYVCDCGHDALADALARVLGETP